jgi:hypothetical protein
MATLQSVPDIDSAKTPSGLTVAQFAFAVAQLESTVAQFESTVAQFAFAVAALVPPLLGDSQSAVLLD